MSDHYYYEECGDMTAPDQSLDLGTEVKSSRKERDKSRSRSRSRSREKRKDKERSRDKKKSRRRSRERSSRNRSRSRSRSRDRSRSRHRSSKRSRAYYDDESDSNESGGKYWEDSPPGYRSYDKYENQRGVIKGKWNDGIPNNVILIRNLPLNSTEQDVKNIFNKHNVSVREVRLMRSRETGQSLRYCFVEFYSIPEAQYWMELNQGELKTEDGSTLYMYYSTTRRGNINNLSSCDTIDSMSDWVCNKCNCKNFQRRTFCRRCSHIREDTTKRLMMNAGGCSTSDGSDQVGSNPCNTLLLRGLDGLTTEESIQMAISQLVSTRITNCRVMRDHMTGVSNGYAFVEFGSVKESKQVLQQLINLENPLEVDGKALIIDYAKNTFSTAISTFETDTLSNSAYYEQTQQTYNNPQDISANQAAAVVQAALLKATQNKKATAIILQQQQLHYQQQAATNTTSLLGPYVPAGSSHSAVAPSAAVAVVATSSAVDSSEYPRYPTPDTSKFTYDEPSGYYYDATTTFYYDAKSQYFYNTQKQHFMYWDGQQHTYIPVANVPQQQTGAATTSADERSESPEKVKVAKKIVKDMEKWAKKLNSQKESRRLNEQQNQLPSQQQLSSSMAPDAGFSLLEKSSHNKNSLEMLDDAYSHKTNVEPPSNPSYPTTKEPPSTSISSLFNYESPPHNNQPQMQQQEDHQQQQQYQQSSLSGSTTSGNPQQNNIWRNESEMIDWSKMTCLLCRRVFTTRETLVKHQQFSDLHKKNLEDYMKSRGEYSDHESQQYRDRARERREKFGESDPPPSRHRRHRIDAEKQAYVTETPTQNGIKEDNVGNRLLQKMGWKDGQGLGKAGQGIVNPIEATIRQSAAGLGSRGSSYNVNPSGSYHDRLKSTFRAYFDEIN